MEGTTVWVNFGPGYLSEAYGTGTSRSPLEDSLLYLDDIIVMSTDFQSHLSRLTEVFERLRQAGLKLKLSKCHLMQTQVNYLGHVMNSADAATDPEKVEAVSR